jgi:hypothetical protein
MDQPPKLLDRLPSLPPRPSSKTNIPAQGKGTQARDEAARKRLTARLEAMSAAALDPPAVDPRTAAVAALMVANFASDEAVRKRFAPLIGAKLFDGNALEDLPVAARFVLRILPKLGPELDQRDTFPMVSLLAQVKALKEDLLRTVGRYLEDIDDAHGRIVTIRLGEGSADDVYDLRMLADLWRDYAETLHTEAGAAYRPEAEREARELATHLELALLGPLSEEDDEWRSYLHRALAMLVPLYDEVCRAGRFLFHHEKPEARFPTLASVARVRRRLRKEASRRTESQPVLQAAPSPSSKPGSVPPEISLVEVSAQDEEALADAMEGVPSLSSVPSTEAPMPGLPLSHPPTAPPPGDNHAIPNVTLSGPPEVLTFDPVEAVKLDFSPTASAGEDADADMDTADLDLELTYASESNFYSDVSGNEVGLFIATFVVKAPGTALGVRLSIPQLDQPIFVSGTVRWVREFSPSIEAPPGMGIALKPLPAGHQRAVSAFMRVRPPILHDD